MAPALCLSSCLTSLRVLLDQPAEVPCFPGADTSDPDPLSQPLAKWLSLLNSLATVSISFPPYGSSPVSPHMYLYHVARRGHTPSPSVPCIFWEGWYVFLLLQYELCGAQEISERCLSFWLWRALWRSLHPWTELCPPTAEQQTWGFFSCHLLPESCMWVPLLLLKYVEVSCLSLAAWTVGSAGHQLLSALQTPNQVPRDVCSS